MLSLFRAPFRENVTQEIYIFFSEIFVWSYGEPTYEIKDKKEKNSWLCVDWGWSIDLKLPRSLFFLFHLNDPKILIIICRFYKRIKCAFFIEGNEALEIEKRELSIFKNHQLEIQRKGQEGENINFWEICVVYEVIVLKSLLLLCRMSKRKIKVKRMTEKPTKINFRGILLISYVSVSSYE